MKRLTALFLSIAAMPAFAGAPQSESHPSPTWYEQFASPSMQARPWTFWYWMFGNVSDEGIRLDLNAMHKAGIKGFYLMPIKDPTDSKDGLGGASRQLSAEWWKRMDTVFHTADSLNLEMGIHFSDGFALAGGPWITSEESMQKVVWSDTIVSGGKYNFNNKNFKLPLPKKIYKDYYEDIALYAYPATYADNRKPEASVEFPFKSTKPCDIVMKNHSRCAVWR